MLASNQNICFGMEGIRIFTHELTVTQDHNFLQQSGVKIFSCEFYITMLETKGSMICGLQYELIWRCFNNAQWFYILAILST